MPFLLDSDLVIDYLNGTPAAVQLLELLAEEGIAISILTYMEVYQGLQRSPNPEQAEQTVRDFLEKVPLIEFSPAVARRCARLRESLRKEGRRVNQRAIDLMIAATALEHDLTLVTRNIQDYEDIPNLKIYAQS